MCFQCWSRPSDILISSVQVMIVNVNPYDTGYDENSHVMKFAALAREVYTTPALAPIQRLPVPSSPSKPTTKSQSWKTREPLRDPEIVPFGYTRKVTIETGGGKGKKVSQAHVEVTEGMKFVYVYI